MKISLILLLSALLPLSSFAQNFTSKAKVNEVRNSAFYRIKINANVISHCNNDLQDLRLFDNEGKEIPYLLNKEKLGELTTEFESYPFAITQTGKRGVVIIENKNKHSLHQFLFEMKNADASRLVRISGSDNKESWFVVRDSFNFESYGSNTAVIQKTLQFPETDYAFYKIEITNGDNEAPLNIIKIGNNNTAAINALLQPVSGLQYKIVEKNKTTFIYFNLQPGNKIDRLEFKIDAPQMFKRKGVLTGFRIDPNADAYSRSSSGIKKYARNVSENNNTIELSSEQPTNIDCSYILGEQRSDSFIVTIENQDDLPLHITDIKAFQLATTITAKLEKDKSYFLYFGDTLLASPTYDLVYFEKNIPRNIGSLDVQAVQPKEHKDKDEYNGKKDKWIVWIGLGIAGITILLLTMNMMKKMKHTEGQ